MYIDPPYNERQYLPNYHILETIAKYDSPIIKGITGLRAYENLKSGYCRKSEVYKLFEDLIQNISSGYILVSYNNEGLLKTEELSSIMKKYSDINKKVKEDKIPRLIDEENRKKRFIQLLNNIEGIKIPYIDLKGKGIPNKGKRSDAPCTGIIQATINAQKPGKEYSDDWTSDGFLRWAISLGFIDYHKETDECTITDFGEKFANTDHNSQEENECLGIAYLSYPPAVRVLCLLYKNDHMTKFEIGEKLGFKGEAGFSSVPQNIFLQGLHDAKTDKEKKDIRSNTEGSSDKYARMIAKWLSNIGWVKISPKRVTEVYGSKTYTGTIKHSYIITHEGRKQIKKALGISSKKQIPKIVYWEMLATKTFDKDYIRTRRALIIQYINIKERSLEEIRGYLETKGYKETNTLILNEIKNFENIGLTIKEISNKYKISEVITKLEIPITKKIIVKSEFTNIKDALREKLNNIDHKYLSLIDLSFDGASNKDFEIETLDLLTNELNFKGLRLGESKRPDGIIYYNKNGIIIDTKAYSKGYNLPTSDADSMIRYIQENNSRSDELNNTTMWWQNFGVEVIHFNYLFISSHFISHFKDKLQAISHRTGINGGVISSGNLLLFAEDLKSGKLSYTECFNLFNKNEEIVLH